MKDGMAPFESLFLVLDVTKDTIAPPLHIQSGLTDYRQPFHCNKKDEFDVNSSSDLKTSAQMIR